MATTEQTRCHHCGRTLRSPRSIALGYGPTCHRKIRRATTATATTAKPDAITKATELIEQGGILPLRGRRVFAVISSDGARTYRTAAQGCTCPAGVKGRHVCYHRVAATILSLAA
ncbi:DUF6011 domain-containing protein [Streptomyces sp. NPDC004031]